MALVVLIIVAIALGFLAQMWKGRTGAGWSFLSTIVLLVTSLITDAAWRINAETAGADEAMMETIAATLGIGGGGILMLLIIASLPRRRSA